ncbi:MAG: nucleoside recognition protein [Planctomycetaceae bacterium]|nr:nucleoside recognition protein [Planctomycetaceae bacterium]
MPTLAVGGTTQFGPGPAGPPVAAVIALAKRYDQPSPLETIGRSINDATFDAAKVSVEIVITLIGAMALWLGLLNIAKDAGLVDALARLLRPALRFLFPEVPDGHPAQGAMLMNIAANMLGLDNAATPMGLKAMNELQTLNPHPDTATNSQAMFLAINTSSVTLIPFTIIAYRTAAGSAAPESPLFGMLLATTVSTIVAIIATRWLSRRRKYQLEPSPAAPAESKEDAQ